MNSWSDSSELKTQWLKNPWVFIATGCGIGIASRMPGSVASGFACLIWWFLSDYFSSIGYVVLVVFGSVIAWLVIWKVEKQFDAHDDKAIVIDEVIGQWVTLLFLPRELWIVVFGFLLFRMLDIWKPWPINKIDRRMENPTGTLLDDIIAGFAACVLTNAGYYFLGA